MTGNISYENLSDSLKQKLTESNVDIVNDLTTGGADKALSAEMGKVLNDKNPEYGVQRINNNHAIRRFPVFSDWANETNREVLQFKLPDTVILGRITVRYSSRFYVTNDGGTAEIQYDIARRNVGQPSVKFTSSLVDITKDFSNMFYISGSVSSISPEFKPYFSLVKRAEKTPLYIEIEYLTNYPHNAGDILEQIETVLISADNAPADPNAYPLQTGALSKASNAVTRSVGGGTYFINPITGNDATGETGSTTKKFRTISAVVNQIPKFLDGSHTIFLDAGIYNEDVNITGFIGGGTITIVSNTGVAPADCKVRAIAVLGCTAKVGLNSFAIEGLSNPCVSLRGSTYVTLSSLVLGTSTFVNTHGVFSVASTAYVSHTALNNRNTCVYADDMSTVYVANCSGTGNTIGLQVLYASTIVKYSNTISASTPEAVSTGGLIRI